MSDGPENDGARQEEPRRTQAAVRRSRWPGWIWAVPIAVAAIVGWLAVRYIVQTGPAITITFQDAAGLRPGESELRYRGLVVGTVETVELSEGADQVAVSVQTEGNVEGLFREGSRFWLVGPDVGLDNLSALGTVVSGPYIEMQPGNGPPTERFEGELQPPAVPPGTAGTRYLLGADRLGSLSIGAPVTYDGLEVGTVSDVRLEEAGGFQVEIFVRAPHDRLVGRSSRFWNAGPLRLSTGAGGFDIELGSPEALIAGRISFDTPGTPDHSAGGSDDRQPEHFRLYTDRQSALAGSISGRRYRLSFDGAVGELEVGSPVTFRGFVVGRVEEVALRYDPERSVLETPVTVELDPKRLGLGGAAAGGGTDSEAAFDQALQAMVGQGLRARLERDPPMIGAPSVTLGFEPAAAPAQLVMGEPYPAIPTAAGSGLEGLTQSAQAVIGDIRRMDLPAIAEAARSAISRVETLVSSPELERSLTNLDRALTDVEAMTGSARGEVGPTIGRVREAAAAARSALASVEDLVGGSVGAGDRSLPAALEEIAAAARAVRLLAEYLERQPESLLQGRSGQ